MAEEKKNEFELDELLANPFGSESADKEISEVETETDVKEKRLVDVLPEDKKKRALQLAEQIDPANFQSVSLYGTEAQSKLMDFSHDMLDHVKNSDIGEIGGILSDLMKKLEQVDPDDLRTDNRGFLAKIFNRVSSSVNQVLSNYQKTGAQIDRISVKLDRGKNELTKDNKLLEQLFVKNKEYFDALNIFIAAGEVKIDELRTKEIPALKAKAEASQNQMMVQEVNDLIQFTDRLEKRTHDLKLSRQITIQSAPQIRLIQNTNQALVEKIQSSILTAIPLWKNQIAIALTLLRQRNAVEAQKLVSETTNDLMLKNSELLRTNTIETAKENERGLVDIETLKKTQEDLISTIEETLTIQAEGREKRQQAEKEMIVMEEEMKQKLLELK
ncbi:toxic anion resistance protein [Oceanobacillus alkalisoli]|uniref:toxic anion resistance protein n=1 Tax=Oceanobacillus alkalisoli TaxID=2925113 RepID=UPI001EF100AC|nr:toxic anion resistance protein [Oceanobacillus alkalisoli]MCF3944400.1 toxic anion resistance protein [Oceanobacillus alkalisoli]MCG5102139.1 toxic anion resistance protein [Oceanobacillus alkalisoli]